MYTGDLIYCTLVFFFIYMYRIRIKLKTNLSYYIIFLYLSIYLLSVILYFRGLIKVYLRDEIFAVSAFYSSSIYLLTTKNAIKIV